MQRRGTRRGRREGIEPCWQSGAFTENVPATRSIPKDACVLEAFGVLTTCRAPIRTVRQRQLFGGKMVALPACKYDFSPQFADRWWTAVRHHGSRAAMLARRRLRVDVEAGRGFACSAQEREKAVPRRCDSRADHQ